MGSFSHLLVTFDTGVFKLYVDGVEVQVHDSGVPWPLNSHSAATLGFIEGEAAFHGCFDDVS